MEGSLVYSITYEFNTVYYTIEATPEIHSRLENGKKNSVK